jgi:SAM-dependent methyltransferase
VDLEELQKHWNRFGQEDPMWAVLTNPDARGNRWDPDQFFHSGVAEVQTVLDWIDEQAARDGGKLSRHRVLDFGCGVGRLTQALAEHFDQCDGVDIAPSMVAEAEQRNRHGSRCRYYVNDRPDLSLFDTASFDLVYSAHVLQHMETRYSKAFIAEFVRLLRPGGYAMLEVVTEPVMGATGALPDDAFLARVELPSPIPRLAPGGRFRLPVRVTNRSPRTWPATGSAGWFFVKVGNHWLDPSGATVTLDDARAELPGDIAPSGVAEVVLTITAPTTPGTYRVEVDLVQEGVAWFASRGSPAAEATVVVESPPAAPGLGRLRPALKTVAGPARGRLRPALKTVVAPALRRLRPALMTVVAPARQRLAILSERRLGVRQGPLMAVEAGADGSDGASESEPVMEMHGLTEGEVAAVVAAAGGRIVGVIDWDRVSSTVSTDWRRRGFLVTRNRPLSTDPTRVE